MEHRVYNTRYQNMRAQVNCLNAVTSAARCSRLSTRMLATLLVVTGIVMGGE